MVDYANLRATVERLSTNPCAVCGGNNWDTFETLFTLSSTERASLDVLTMICTGCASIRLYSYPHLQRLVEQQ